MIRTALNRAIGITLLAAWNLLAILFVVLVLRPKFASSVLIGLASVLIVLVVPGTLLHGLLALFRKGMSSAKR